MFYLHGVFYFLTFKNTSPLSSTSKPPRSSRIALVAWLMWIRRAVKWNNEQPWESRGELLLLLFIIRTNPNTVSAINRRVVNIFCTFSESHSNVSVLLPKTSEHFRRFTRPKNVSTEVIDTTKFVWWRVFNFSSHCHHNDKHEKQATNPRREKMSHFTN